MCLCLLQVGVLSKVAECIIELVFGLGASFHLFYTVQKKFKISPKMVLAYGTLSQTPDIKKFALARRSLKRVISLARQGGRS